MRSDTAPRLSPGGGESLSQSLKARMIAHFSPMTLSHLQIYSSHLMLEVNGEPSNQMFYSLRPKSSQLIDLFPA